MSVKVFQKVPVKIFLSIFSSVYRLRMQLFRLQLLTFGLFATCILVVVLQVRASDEDEATEKPPTEEEKETVTEETTEEPPKV